MRNLIINLLLAFVTIVSFHGCDNDRDNPRLDAITMATPDGGTMKPAEEGPERSTFNVPDIDLNTFQLEVKGLVDTSFSLNW